MKIGVLSDIHGNSDALIEVLKIARKEKISKLLILGDVVGYYYYPDKVLDILKEWEYLTIRGNHEILLSKMLSGEVGETEIMGKYGSGHKIALDKLAKEQINNLLTEPDIKDICIDNTSFQMCHGTPWNASFYLYPDSAKELLEKCDNKMINFVLIGHSHYPFAFKNRNSVLINAGSVGQLRNFGGLASWIVINTENQSFEIKYTPYDTTTLIKEVERTDPEITYLKTVLLRNRG